MAGADVVGRLGGGLTARIVVGVILIVVACGAVWAGGIAFTVLVACATLLMSAEWSVMHGISRGFRLASLIVLAFVGGISVTRSALDAVSVLALAAILLGTFMRGVDRSRGFWLTLGLLYCGLPMIALLWLRDLPQLGIALAISVLAIVWATDIGAYFVGRAVGGAKLAPTISPSKTWSGALGGVVAAAVTGGIFAKLAAGQPLDGDRSFMRTFIVFVVVAVVLAVVAIGGDLFESWLKRRAGVKDSGNLLPGHGGVMDRLDGLVPVVVVAAVLVAVSGVAQ